MFVAVLVDGALRWLTEGGEPLAEVSGLVLDPDDTAETAARLLAGQLDACAGCIVADERGSLAVEPRPLRWRLWPEALAALGVELVDGLGDALALLCGVETDRALDPALPELPLAPGPEAEPGAEPGAEPDPFSPPLDPELPEPSVP